MSLCQQKKTWTAKFIKTQWTMPFMSDTNPQIDPAARMQQESLSGEYCCLTTEQKCFCNLFKVAVPIYNHNQVSVQYGMANACFSLSDGAFQLCLIRTCQDQRSKGHASTLLKRICGHADIASVKLILRVHAKEAAGLTDSQLHDWYEKNGFVDCGNAMMERIPIGSRS